jgi:hypothetical protein
MLSESEDENKSNLISFLNALKVEETVNPNMNSYYKGVLTVHQNILEFILIVPFAYPRQKSTISILEWHKKKDDDKKAINLGIPCKF